MFFKVVLENKVCCSPSLVYRAVNMNGIPCPTGTSLCPMRYGASLLHALHFACYSSCHVPLNGFLVTCTASLQNQMNCYAGNYLTWV